MTEKEVFGDVNNPLWINYIFHKVHFKIAGKTPIPPEVWVCGQTLSLIDKGQVTGITREEIKDTLNVIGWSSSVDKDGHIHLNKL